MHKIILTTTLLLASLTARAQTGETFPDLTGKTITGKNLTLPDDIKGKYTLLGVAYSQKSQDDLETWFQPVYETFLSENKSMWETSDAYDVNIYFVPMLNGLKKAAAGKVEKRMKNDLDPALKSHVLLYVGSLKEFKEALDLGAKDEPTFFVLDADGRIVYRTQGAYSEQKMADIEGELGE
ncbi:MAG: hypothetical protein WBA12_09695 [Catalinimonas sp.]